MKLHTSRFPHTDTMDDHALLNKGDTLGDLIVVNNRVHLYKPTWLGQSLNLASWCDQAVGKHEICEPAAGVTWLFYRELFYLFILPCWGLKSGSCTSHEGTLPLSCIPALPSQSLSFFLWQPHMCFLSMVYILTFSLCYSFCVGHLFQLWTPSCVLEFICKTFLTTVVGVVVL